MAKNVRLVAARVLNCQGSGTNSGVIAGVDWVTGNHTAGRPAVANMSLGGGANTALDNAVNNSTNDGVSYAVAAGNDGANACSYSPARVGTAVTGRIHHLLGREVFVLELLLLHGRSGTHRGCLRGPSSADFDLEVSSYRGSGSYSFGMTRP